MWMSDGAGRGMEAMVITWTVLLEIMLTAGVRGSCPPEWLRWGDHCYLVVDTPRNWTEAQRHCDQQGADLASVASSEEDSFVANLTVGLKEYWLGMYGCKRADHYAYYWRDGSLVTWTSWATGHPNNASPYVKVTGGDWANVKDVTESLPSVCKREPASYVSVKYCKYVLTKPTAKMSPEYQRTVPGQEINTCVRACCHSGACRTYGYVTKTATCYLGDDFCADLAFVSYRGEGFVHPPVVKKAEAASSLESVESAKSKKLKA